MKISRAWLQTYFDSPLPEAQALADALTFHAFEIEDITTYDVVNSADSILDVKVTPNRGHDCLSHYGVAKDLSAILNIPLKRDPLTARLHLAVTDAVSVSVDTPLCARYVAGYIRGVKVAPSPPWLKNALESVGQRSINNIVDATNYVMFDLGQPIHAFDAGKLSAEDGKYAIDVRAARKGEKMLALDDKEYAFNEHMLLISDTNANVPIGIAGIKGGKPSGVDSATTDIILESANFDGVSVRRTAHALKLRTDASQRFEQAISPEIAQYGARAAADLIVQIAAGALAGFVDVYPVKNQQRTVSASVAEINQILGTELTGADVANVFARLGFSYKEESGVFDVIPPIERLDILITEDLVEEVGRIIGYDKIVATELSSFSKKPAINKNFYAAERLREDLVSQGYSEVYTSVFADVGERAVANKVDSTYPYLRANLTAGLQKALEKNVHNKDLLGIKEVKLFEIGVVWRDGKEIMMIGTATEKEKATEKLLGGTEASAYDDLPLSETERYQPFSRFPYIVRDIAMWVPRSTESDDVLAVLKRNAGTLLVRSELFDRFEKGEKLSLAFRLVFQSLEKTLTDAEANALMGAVHAAVVAKGWEVR